MYQDKASFDVTFEVYDYTASGIDYIAGDMYSAKTGHTANLQDALAASKKNIRRALCLWIIQRSNKAPGIMK